MLGIATVAARSVALAGFGAYALIQARRADPADEALPAGRHTGRLIITGLALSIDNLAVGFALGTYHLNLAVSAAVIGAVSVAMSLTGLELGARIGTRTGRYGEYLGGAILTLVGAAIAAGLTNSGLRRLHLTDVRDGRLHTGNRTIPLAGPARDRVTAWLDERSRC